MKKLEKPKIVFDDLQEQDPKRYEVINKLLYNYAILVNKAEKKDFQQSSGVEKSFEDLIKAYDSGIIRLSYDTEKKEFYLEVYNYLEGKFEKHE